MLGTKGVASALRALVDECKIRLTQSGFHIRAVDPANVAMVEQDIGKAAFETYEIDEDSSSSTSSGSRTSSRCRTETTW